jgi:3-polyprenyl-4-hydroxybenzoate decarboxylase
MNLGSKMVLDALGRRGHGPGDPPRPASARASEIAVGGREETRARRGMAAQALVGRLPGVVGATILEDCLLVVAVEGEDRGREAIESLVVDPVFAGLKLIAAVSPDVPLDDPMLVVWGIFTRFDAARDIVFTETRLRGAWPTSTGRLGIDATWKPGYPEPVAMPTEIVARVDQRWGEIWR